MINQDIVFCSQCGNKSETGYTFLHGNLWCGQCYEKLVRSGKHTELV